MRKNRIRTNNLRTIRKSVPRFFSLMIMSALGVFVFAGLTATAPDMIASVDHYLDQYQGYDARVVSDMGLTDEDVDALMQVDGVELAEPVNQQDVEVTLNENQKVIRIASVPENIYQLTLLSGHMPEKDDEIVVEENLLRIEGLSLGDTLTLDDDAFVNHNVTIVGTVKSAMYYNSTKTHQNRGDSSVGSGTVNYYAYVSMENFDRDYYTAIYVTGAGLEDLTTSTDAYTKEVSVLTDHLDAISEERENARYEQLYEEGQEKIDDARSEADEKLSDAKDALSKAKKKLSKAKKKLADGRKTLDDTKIKLTDAKKAIDDGWSEYNAKASELKAALKKLKKAKKTIAAKEKTLEKAKKKLKTSKKKLVKTKDKLDNAKTQLTQAKTQLDSAKKQLDRGKKELQKSALQISAAKDALKAQGYTEEQISAAMADMQSQYDAAENTYDQKKAVYDRNKSAYDSQKKTYEEGLTAYKKGKASYDSGYGKYQAGVKALKNARKTYKEGLAAYNSGKTALSEAKTKLEKSEAEYESGLQEYNEGEETYKENLSAYKKNLKKYEKAKTKYQDKKEEADEKIADAEAELEDLTHPTWYVYDREDDSTYKDYIQDAETIENLAFLFPVVFYLVAVLVSLISMNRMVEDDRLEIGTMKSLGFSNGMIISKYVVFSLCATLAGGVLGALSGLYIIPNLIFNIYRILFDLPELVLSFHGKTTLLGMALAVICVCGTSILTAHQVLKEKPSDLMRPKAPKNGKRIFMERIPAIWSRLSFSNKITVRNLARYKKRVLITIGGIVGCTALMLTGFGIKDSIVDLPSTQYGEVFHFDGTAYVNGLDEGKETEEIDEIMKDAGLHTYVATDRLNITLGDLSGYIMAAEDDSQMSLAVNLRDLKTGEKLTLTDDCVIISDKLADLMDLSVGDEISFQDMDRNQYHCKVGGICVNYVENYVFMTKAMLEKTRTFEPNLVYFHVDQYKGESDGNEKNSAEETALARDVNLSEEEKDALSEKLLSHDEVLNVSYIDDLIENVQNMLKSLDSVVLILVVLSAALSFVVLYNLANININERKREIATLKVLGFFDREVDHYITKETIFTTLVGIVLGLLAGTVLSRLVVMTIEIDMARFINQVKPLSYAYSAAFAVLFTWIVNKIIHFALLRIDMIDSLKSVE